MATVSQLFKQYYQALVSSLPMKDAVFACKLMEKGLLPSNVIDELGTLDTSEERAAYFLDKVIERKIDEKSISFDALLVVMEKSTHDSVKQLAMKIKHDYKWCIKCTYMQLVRQE